jgi:hypothetical protein
MNRKGRGPRRAQGRVVQLTVGQDTAGTFQVLTAVGGRFSVRELTNTKRHPSHGPQRVFSIFSEQEIWPMLELHLFNCLSSSVSVQGPRAPIMVL